MSHSVAVIARFTPRPEKRDALRDLLDGIVTPTRAEEGCRTYDLYEIAGDGAFVLFERYRDHNVLQEHRRTSHYVNYRAQPGELLGEPISVTELVALDEA